MFSSNTSAVSGDANYIEDVFSTYLYTGTSATQAINNGIDLTSKGGLVWVKKRTNVSPDSTTNGAHQLLDTVRGNDYALTTNDSTGQFSGYAPYFSFASNGFTLSNSFHEMNAAASLYVSWTFRKQQKFFDVVTYTGTGANRTVAHNLGSVPGCIIVKRLDTTGNWQAYHRSLANTEYLVLNSNAAKATGATRWNSTTPTATEFSLGTDATVNANGGTYVAYIFAHDAGGFGLTGTENVISCGSFTTDGSGNAVVSLGWEPQWLLVKRSSATSNWALVDNMRGWPVGGGDAVLYSDLSNAENVISSPDYFSPTSTGFQWLNGWGGTGTGIYIAIRRGPMKVPTDGTKVFSPIASSGASGTVLSVGFPADADLWCSRSTSEKGITDRLRGFPTSNAGTMPWLVTQTTAAEASYSASTTVYNVDNTSATLGSYVGGASGVNYFFRRAPGFFDVVCYTGNGDYQAINHNLTVTPQMIIMKRRDAAGDWGVYFNNGATEAALLLNSSAAKYGAGIAFSTSSTTFAVFNSGFPMLNSINGATYVAYLFASCPGVSKVGSYTGTGTTQQINCGFTAGARFVLIKRTDSTGDWYVWDSARGIVAGNDPYLLLNSTAAEVTSTDYIDTYSAGFEISSTAPAAINASGGTFIYLAIA